MLAALSRDDDIAIFPCCTSIECLCSDVTEISLTEHSNVALNFVIKYTLFMVVKMEIMCRCFLLCYLQKRKTVTRECGIY